MQRGDGGRSGEKERGLHGKGGFLSSREKQVIVDFRIGQVADAGAVATASAMARAICQETRKGCLAKGSLKWTGKECRTVMWWRA